jgi:hypothetical protein
VGRLGWKRKEKGNPLKIEEGNSGDRNNWKKIPRKL